MSYDLFFRSRASIQELSYEAFVRYFSGRRFFKVQGPQAWYSNEDTGVYFLFEHGEPLEAEEMAEAALVPVAFNLNYYRPHVFGLEAEPEVAAFVKHFNLTVSDPQTSGMGDSEYSRDGFLGGWNAGNASGYRALLSRDPSQHVITLPTSQIEMFWRWNLHLEQRQKDLGDDVFVPIVIFLEDEGRAKTGVVWTDGIPVLLPVVDLVVVPRQELAPRSWLRRKDDIVVFEWAELEPLLRPFQQVPGEPWAFQLFYDTTPQAIENAIKSKKPPLKGPSVVDRDQVLCQELVEAARA